MRTAVSVAIVTLIPILEDLVEKLKQKMGLFSNLVKHVRQFLSGVSNLAAFRLHAVLDG